MNETTSQLSNLLALRDGEPLDLEVASALEDDPRQRERLAELRGIKAALQDLPPVEPDPDQWEQIVARATQPKRSWSMPYPLATAASVFLAAALSIMVLVPGSQPEPSQPTISVPQTGMNLTGLMNRSQQLEAQVSAPGPQTGWNPSQEALMYRIADIDAELNSLFALEGSSESIEQRKQELWAQRVQLLEDLREVQRGQAVLRPAVM